MAFIVGQAVKLKVRDKAGAVISYRQNCSVLKILGGAQYEISIPNFTVKKLDVVEGELVAQ